jgi:KUP system potassium uptake protein
LLCKVDPPDGDPQYKCGFRRDYFLGRETLIVTESPGLARWRERLFALMARNAVRATTFFRLPPERVIELGVQVEI